MAKRLSRRGYGRHRGCDEKSVRRAIAEGRITLGPDGRIDPERADAEWEANSHPGRGKAGKNAKPQQGPVGKGAFQNGHTPSYMEARAQKMTAEAALTELKLKERSGKLIERELVTAAFFAFFRQLRDLIQTWPARVSGSLATELRVDHREMSIKLDQHIRELLEDIATAEPPPIIIRGRRAWPPTEEKGEEDGPGELDG